MPRERKDGLLTVTRALTATDGTVYSSDIDLGDDEYKGENMELLIEIPALLNAELASADTLVVAVVHGAAAAPTTALGLTKTFTGAGAGLAATSIRWRLPSNTLRYLRVSFTTAGTTGDMSDKTVEINLVF